jgi:hypothetical protein
MDIRRIFPGSISICIHFLLTGCSLLAITACEPNKSPSLLTPVIVSLTSTPEPPTSGPPTSTLPPQLTPTITCTDNLAFIDDVTIPDNSVVAPGSLLDKQWRVQNNGNCNWDARYRLRLVSGDALGASNEQALYPARAGTQANFRILYTAPQETGEYVSEWQAFDANGIPFGETFFIKIIVQ